MEILKVSLKNSMVGRERGKFPAPSRAQVSLSQREKERLGKPTHCGKGTAACANAFPRVEQG